MLSNSSSLNWAFWFGLNTLLGQWNYNDGSYIKNSFGFDINGIPNYNTYPWGPHEPNNIDDKEQCCHFWREIQFKWNDNKCNSELMSLCDKNAPKSCGINIHNLKVWYKGGLNDVSNNGNAAINITGNIYSDISDCSIYGDINSSFIIPHNINTTSYTIIYVGKYNGNNKERILTSSNNTNYYAGFGNGKSSGICYQGGNITDFINESNNDWLISTAYPGGCHVNGTNISNNIEPWLNEFDPGTFKIGINIFNKHNIKENSDWKIYEILIFDIILSEYQMNCIENYLSQEHSIPIPSYNIIPTIRPTKTCPQPMNYSSDFQTQQPRSTMPSTNPTMTPLKSPTHPPSNMPSLTPFNIAIPTPTNHPSITRIKEPTKQSSNPSSFKTSNNNQSLSPTNTPSNHPTKNQIMITINKPTTSSALKFTILGSTSTVCCICCLLCCLMSVVIFKKHNHHNKMMLTKHTTDNNELNDSNNQTISLPPVIPQPTSGNINEYSENKGSEGVIIMPGDTITNNIPHN